MGCSYYFVPADANQVLEIHKISDRGENVTVAEVQYGSGLVITDIDYDDLAVLLERPIEECETIIDQAVAEAKTRPAIVNKELQSKIRLMIQLNKQREELADELAGALDNRFDMLLTENAENPILGLSDKNIVAGTVETDSRGKKYLSVSGNKAAGQNGFEGYYSYQAAGYCEDDYFGVQYISLGNGKYLKLDFCF